MDARETLAEWMTASKGRRYVFPGDYEQADDLLAALTASGFTIIHDSENHGPTLERAVSKLEQRAKVFDDVRPGKAISMREEAAAIRAMGDKK